MTMAMMSSGPQEARFATSRNECCQLRTSTPASWLWLDWVPNSVRLLRQTGFVLSWDMAAKVLTALATILIIRLLSPWEYAIYTLVIALVGVMSQIVSSGVNRIYVLSYDRLGIGGRPGSLLSIQIVLGLA